MNQALNSASPTETTDRPQETPRLGSINLDHANSAISSSPPSCAEGGAGNGKGSGGGKHTGGGGVVPHGGDGPEFPKKPTNFEEALRQIAGLKLLTEDTLRRIRSDVTTAARCVRESSPQKKYRAVFGPADLPCDPVELRPLLRLVMPGKFWVDKPGKVMDESKLGRLSRVKHRWSNVRASTTKVLVLTDWIDKSRCSTVELTPAWTKVADCHVHSTQQALVRRFGRYCVQRGVAPTEVTEETIEEFRNHLTQRTLELDVTASINALRRAWNKSCGTIDCGISPLAARKRPKSYVLTNEELPAGFLLDLEAYLALLSKPGPFDGSRIGRPRKAITVNCLREVFKRCVSVALMSGVGPSDVTTVSDLGKPASVRAILTDQYMRLGEGRAWPPGAATLASYLKMIIKHSTELSDEEKRVSVELCGNVKSVKAGMTRKNRDRLAILDDPKLLDRLLSVPSECYKMAEAWDREAAKTDQQGDLDSRAKGKMKAAHLYQRALALELLFTKPLRRATLAALNPETHFEFDAKGVPRSFCIPGTETKNGQDAEATLPKGVGEHIKIYVERYRPRLMKNPTPYLFHGKYGGHVHPQTLANGLVSIVNDYAGLPFNVHLGRHLVACLILDDNPSNGPIAQRMLDHADLKTTTRFYGIQRTKSAQAEYAKILEARTKKSPPPKPRSPKSPPEKKK